MSNKKKTNEEKQELEKESAGEKISKEDKDSKDGKASKDAKDSKDGKASKDAKASKDTKANTRVDGFHLPKPTFSTFVLSLGSSALVQLGEVPSPETGKTEENLKLAKHSIDILNMLDEKTKNGLDAEESRLMEGLLYELRMKYLVKTK